MRLSPIRFTSPQRRRLASVRDEASNRLHLSFLLASPQFARSKASDRWFLLHEGRKLYVACAQAVLLARGIRPLHRLVSERDGESVAEAIVGRAAAGGAR